MAASPPTVLELSRPYAIASASALAPNLTASSTGSAASTPAASASSPPGPDTPGSVSSAGSAAPPIAIRPGTATKLATIQTSASANRMAMTSVLSPSAASAPQLTMTTKEWVIPPRPKPGRKPATDTPPTKRKAQNRAAQRAFRERRAARVGELEEQLDEQREENLKKEQELEDRIRHLEAESETLRARCQWLEGTLEKERLDRIRQGMQAESIRNGFGALLSNPPSAQSPSAGQVVGPRPMPQPFSISSLITPPDELEEAEHLSCGTCPPTGPCSCAEDLANTPIGCGKCTLDSRCECLESLQAATAGNSDLKRPLPPSSPSSSLMPGEKRHKSDAGPASPMEIDFTAMFSQQKKPATEEPPATNLILELQDQDQPMISVEMRDNCGFCKDGTYCVCADTSLISTPITSSMSNTTSLTALAPIQQQQTHTPPPSEYDVIPMEVTATGAIKLPPFRKRQQPQEQQQKQQPAPQPSSGSKCGPNGPGTCAQCLSDPISGLFCRSLAANLQRSRGSGPGSGPSGGCCGGSSGGGGCCKQQKPEKPKPSLSLSCADAYKTLASHRYFEEATDDIGEWVPRLKMAPVHVEGREPMEVEAASIMSVLKGFDIRFGRGE